MILDYARVPTEDQNLSLQLDALQAAGCSRNFTDTVSGANRERPRLSQAFDHLREGDTLVVWRLDRLGRSLANLIELMTWLEGRKVAFRSLTEQIDTTTSGGNLFFHVFGALAEFERNLIRERTMAGSRAARARGLPGGRPRSLESKKVAMAQSLYDDRNNSIRDVCKTLGISRATVNRYIKPRTPSDREE